ncbi:hypothetical protein, partial [Phocaeicola vulgatus]|uniref:hypothetical protein n=1 Tax=Phocaeicola vulgatus TaxID=821 RepID=UPI0016125CE8
PRRISGGFRNFSNKIQWLSSIGTGHSLDADIALPCGGTCSLSAGPTDRHFHLERQVGGDSLPVLVERIVHARRQDTSSSAYPPTDSAEGCRTKYRESSHHGLLCWFLLLVFLFHGW